MSLEKSDTSNFGQANVLNSDTVRPTILNAINNGVITWNQFFALSNNVAALFQPQQGNVVASATNVPETQQMNSHNTPSLT